MTGATGFSTPRVLGISAAMGLVPLNSTMIAVALPKIADDFEISTGRTGILIIIYLFAMLIGQPIAGRLSDSIGNRRMMNIALVGMIVCSALAAAATTFALLVVARVAQAAFAAALGPSIQSLLRSITPSERQGQTFGLMGSVLGVGAASGPVIGGVLTQAFGWQAIFLVNIPIATVALLTALRMEMPESVTTVPENPVDSAVSGRIANPVFVTVFSIHALATLAQYTLLLLTPIILDARGWESGPTGVVLSALTIGMIVTSPLGGRLGDRYGRRFPSRVGLTIGTGAVAMLLIAGPGTSTAVLVFGLAIFGLGLGATTPSLMTSALESVPMHRSGAAAGVFSMSRYVGSITTSIAVSVLVSSDSSGSRAVLAIAVASMAVAVAGTAALPHQKMNAEI